MKLVLKIFLILLISFYAITLSYPSRWLRWNEWKEHINTYHQKNK